MKTLDICKKVKSFGVHTIKIKDNLNKINCNMEDYLNSLDTLYNIDNDSEDCCCNNHENHSISHEKISCYNYFFF